MKVLFLAAEVAPLAKVGGLGDVAGELPRALRRMGVDVRLALPFHSTISRDAFHVSQVAQVSVERSGQTLPSEVWQFELDSGPAYLLDGEPVQSAKGVYGDPEHELEKFLFSNLSALKACEVLDWCPDIVHAHDWHAAFAVIWLEANRREHAFWSGTQTVFTIHNLGYMGAEEPAKLEAYGLSSPENDALPDWARFRPLAMGIAASDWISTVSRTYSEEILSPAYGQGLETLLSSRKERLEGILNGIDPQVWNPAQDPDLPIRFSLDDLQPRAEMKALLQAELDLPLEARVPLLAMITRMDHQKGVDLAVGALEGLMETPWQFVLLGSGDRELEAMVSAFTGSQPERMRSILRFDSGLARRIYAGADMILLPSRYEPSGLAQMIGMRYGCVPVARATGGLKDTVIDESRGAMATGFLFDGADVLSLREALIGAMRIFAEGERWRQLQRMGMAQDFGWGKSAQRYLEVYRKASRPA